MKKRMIGFPLHLLACIVCLAIGCAPPPTTQRSESPMRLVSTVPNITEILFDIGLGDRIVGDSKFTKYPPEAEKIKKIGDLYDVNWEEIARMEVDLALILIENEELRERCQKLGIETLSVDHQSMEGVLASYDLIGERFGLDVMRTTQERKAALESKLEDIRSRAAAFPPVRVLICIDRTRGSGRLQNMYVAGTNPYFQNAIRWAGGINVAETTGLPVPVVSNEGVIAMNPDVIVDLMIGESSGLSEDDLTGDWKTLGNEVNAVKTGRIHVLTEDYVTIPGPRTPLFVEKLLEILHGNHREKTDDNEQ